MPPSDPFALAGLVGWPVAQSRSPVIHNHWLARKGIAGRYLLLPTPGDALADALRGLPLLGFRGCNVTMPHKQAAFTLLDHVDPAARRIGAVNTVVVRDDGSLAGFNFDGPGFVSSVREACPAWRAADGPVLVLGAGGAARAVVAALLEAGANAVTVVNRTAERAERLAVEIGGSIGVLPWDRRNDAMADAALLINTTDRGMAGKPALEISLARLPAASIVADLIYAPLETPLLRAAREAGHPTVNGLGMLLHQASLAFEAWFGIRPEITAALRDEVIATF